MSVSVLLIYNNLVIYQRIIRQIIFMITPLMLTGRSTDHLVTLSGDIIYSFNATKAFLALQQQAAKAGFKLMPASSFRSFERQLAIWNGKFEGARPA